MDKKQIVFDDRPIASGVNWRAVLGVAIALSAIIFVMYITVSLQKSKQGITYDLPSGRTAGEYYRLGIEYKARGWTEQAREALSRAITLGRGTNISIRAERFLATKIPRYPVPEEAMHMNIEGFNLDHSANQAQAEKVWLECIRKYPNFEWPYGNLGILYVNQGKYKEGEALLHKALSINPSYLNAWLHLSESRRQQKDYVSAAKYINKALDLDSEDSAAQEMSAQKDRE